MRALVTLVFVMCFVSSYGQFRNVTWGMYKDKVKVRENHVVVRDYLDVLSYNIPTDDMECLLEYSFNKDRLVEASYTFTPIAIYEGGNVQEYIWSRTIKNLKEKYGEPVKADQDRQMVWDLKEFTIRALNLGTSRDEKPTVTVTYYPPISSQKDLL